MANKTIKQKTKEIEEDRKLIKMLYNNVSKYKVFISNNEIWIKSKERGKREFHAFNNTSDDFILEMFLLLGIDAEIF